MTAYYNENDPKAAAWLRELIARGLIAPGVVDERSITEVRADDLRGHEQVHFFAGIGGWSYALRLAGWPDDRPVWTGSCPCQPFSAAVAGRGRGEDDERHLWPQFLRLIAECRPPVCLGEQVASKDGLRWFAGVRADLKAEGYAVGGVDLAAAGFGAPHPRQRIFWLADAGRQRDRDQGPGADSGAAGGVQEPTEERQRLRPEPGERSAGLPGVALSSGGRPEDARDGGDGRDDQPAPPPGEARLATRTGGARGLGDPGRVGLHRLDGRGARAVPPDGCQPSFWVPFDIAWCRDPKGGPDIPRRVEPGSFPLAHGVPARVGRLRGYGNAICPQVAAEFVIAYMMEVE